MDEMQADQGRGSRSGISRWVSVAMVILGAVAAVIGLVLFLLPSGQSSIGWFAYEPLSTTTFLPLGVFLTPQNQIGIVVLVVGVAVLAFGAGWALGRRHAASRRRAPDRGNPGA